MTEAQELELLRKVPSLHCEEEITAFRNAIRERGEEMTTALYAALIQQADRVRRK